MTRQDKVFVLSLDPFSRGFAYVLFEGFEHPYDWGIKEIKEKHKNEKTLGAIKDLVFSYRPRVIVIEDMVDRKQRRSSRIKKLYRKIAKFAAEEHIDLHRIPRRSVKACFGSLKGYEVAQVVSKRLPGFQHRMPRIRKAWMSEDPRQHLFDAAALGLTFYHFNGVPSPYDGVDA